MLTLHISFTKTRTGREVSLRLDDGGLVETAVCSFAFAPLDEDIEHIRWYLEDYLMYPVDPAPLIAGNVEDRMREIGSELFSAVFSSTESRYLWSIVKPRIHETRIEIVDDRDSASIPWELMQEPTTGDILSIRASAFVRTSTAPITATTRITPGNKHVRILLVISRPHGRKDVGFRATAKHIINQLHDLTPTIDIDVLRPPTFSRLQSVLWSAREDGQPYDIVHFDGHGTWTDLAEQTGLPVESSLRGYVLFEGAKPGDVAYVDGKTMGNLLRQCEVPILLLNACRSGHHDPFNDAEAADQPETGTDATPAKAYGSFAQEVCEAGVAGVVAMRYNIFVVTAAQFVADLYRAMLLGKSLGEAVSAGRRQLADYPMREVTSHPRRLQDWIVPVVYESESLSIVAPAASRAECTPLADQIVTLREEPARIAPLALADQSRYGFYGRDDTLFDLDRAFTSYNAVLLHGYAGEGKTASAIEFARWYAKTGGLHGPVIYTSFGSRQTIESLADEIGKTFDDLLKERDISWLTLEETDRLDLASKLLREFGGLWIWDNFELIGDPATRAGEEQSSRSAVLEILAKMKPTGVKFLITSTRPEPWLGSSIHEIQIEPMPMMERLQLARAVAKYHDTDISSTEDWIGLLRYTQGNPLTIIIAVTQAIRSRLTAKADLDSFVSRLQSGEAAIADDASIMSNKIGLVFGKLLEEEFDSDDVAVLSVLSMFRHFVDNNQLLAMNPVMARDYPGDEPPPYSPSSVVRDPSHPLHPLASLLTERISPLLNQCVDLGLLTPWKVQDQIFENAYHIHPAFASYLQQIFKRKFGSTEESTGRKIAYCFVGAYAQLASLSQHLLSTESSLKSMFTFEYSAQEYNFIHALQLAVTHGLWGFVPYIADGLGLLYESTGRLTDWARVVNEISPLVVDRDTHLPVQGREELWEKFVHYQIQVASLTRDWDLIERLSRLLVTRFRGGRDGAQNAYELADSLKTLGEALSIKGDDEGAISVHRDAIKIYQEVEDRKAEAEGWLWLGNTLYRQSIGVSLAEGQRCLDEAERCYKRSMTLGDHANRVDCTGQLAAVAFSRFIKGTDYALSGSASEADTGRWVDQCLKATELYEKYLDLQSEEDVHHRAYAHSQLGQLYGRMREELPFVMEHFNRAIELYEFEGNRYQAGHTRREASLILVVRKRYMEASLYAQAALDDFQSYGVHAEREDIEVIQRMISGIERRAREADQG